MVAHDVHAPGVVDAGNRLVADLGLASSHRAEMYDQPLHRLAGVLDLDLPARLRHRDDGSGVGNLAAGLDVKGRLGQHHAHRLALTGLLDRLAIADQRQQRRFDFQTCIWVVGHRLQFAALTQLLAQGAESGGLVGGGIGVGALRSRNLSMMFHGLEEPGLVGLDLPLPRQVAGDLQRQSEGGVQVKRPLAGKVGCTFRLQLVQPLLKLRDPTFDGAGELALFLGDQVLDRVGVLCQLGVGLAVVLDHRLSHLAHKGPVEADLGSE